MAKAIHCPNCNAEITYKGYNQRVKCEYCRSNVVISINETLMNEIYQQNGNSIDNLSEQEISQMKRELILKEYKARNRKWIKKVVITVLVIFLLAFLTGFSSINVFDGTASGAFSTALLYIVAIVFGLIKPVSPLKNAVSSKVIAGIVIYIITNIVLTLGFFAAVAVNDIINSEDPENGYTIIIGNGTYKLDFEDDEE
ncbi:MAG: hypothetical protein IKV85_01425 [Ruminococcus sp.]|nr:hypothetical protein [Ruminococcus sp.]